MKPGEAVEFTLDGVRTTVVQVRGGKVRVEGVRGWLPITDFRTVAPPLAINVRGATEPDALPANAAMPSSEGEPPAVMAKRPGARRPGSPQVRWIGRPQVRWIGQK